jgi:molybdopterin molybdotransferase
MLTPAEAAERILQRVPPLRVETRPLSEALGYALAEAVVADMDLPPFDKSAMDGFAVRAADTAAAPVELAIVEEIPAGTAPRRTVGPGQCARIMTGAPIPAGADAVVKVEDSRPAGADRVRLQGRVVPGQHVCARGEDLRQGTTVLRPGAVLRPSEIAVLASVGRARVSVTRRPTCAMLSTGDELVGVEERPGPGQIRNSNAPSVAAQVRSMGFSCDVLPTARDTLESLRAGIVEGLRRDVLILSGGVSVGGYDRVIEALRAEGVEAVLHQVAIKPGKPFFFGAREDRRVFGLPGNPVSSFVIFEVFVRPFLGAAAGLPTLRRELRRARLAERHAAPGERTCLLPARLERDGNELWVRLVPWNGSADIVALTRSDAFVVVPPQAKAVQKGDWVDVMIMDPGLLPIE